MKSLGKDDISGHVLEENAEPESYLKKVKSERTDQGNPDMSS